MKKYDIFISFSRKDFDEVNAIVEMLKTRIPKLNCWFDITGIESGDLFQDKIITAIDNSSYVLFVLSDNSIQSQYAKDEVMYAKNTDTRVIPLLLKNAQLKGWFLFNFGRIDCIDTTSSLQIEKLIKNLSDWTGKAITNESESSSSYTYGSGYSQSSKNTSNSNTKQETLQDHSQDASSKIHTIYNSNGKLVYEGEMKNGLYHGQGTLYGVDGCKWEGQFVDGKLHGQGKSYYANGKIEYDGQWENYHSHGKGIEYYENGDTYEGEFSEGKPNGQGTLYYADGKKYEGEFYEGKPNGQGTFYYANGEKYVGEVVNGKRNGQGTIYYYGNNKYVGGFKNDQLHGYGTYYYIDGIKENVKYDNGNLVEQRPWGY